MDPQFGPRLYPHRTPMSLILYILYFAYVRILPGLGVIAIFAASILTTFGVGTTAHDTPDGFVERAVAVVIQGRTVSVSIQIGINAKTMRDVLAECDISEEFQSDEELTRCFCEILKNQLVDDWSLEVEGERLKPMDLNVEPYAEHHKTAVLKFQAKIPESVEDASFRLIDHSFLNLDGAVRYALKSKGNSLLTNTDVAPIIIRAKRIELSSMSEAQRKEACQINARFVIVPTKGARQNE